MSIFDSLAISDGSEQYVQKCVVRLSTNTWADKKGIHTKRSLTYLKRKCVGHNILDDARNNVGAKNTLGRITNLDECADGVYVVNVCNVRHDFESGHVDYLEYELIAACGGEV